MRSDDSQESLGQILKWGSWRHCFHSWTCQPRVLGLRWESLGYAEEDFTQWADSPIINTQVKMNPILNGNKCCDIRLCDFYLFIYGFLDSLVFKRLGFGNTAIAVGMSYIFAYMWAAFSEQGKIFKKFRVCCLWVMLLFFSHFNHMLLQTFAFQGRGVKVTIWKPNTLSLPLWFPSYRTYNTYL